MELRGIRGPVGGQDLRGLGFGIPATGIPASSIITAVQQQDYSASVWLRRRDKLEHSQQKCIVIFALVCCFAVLVALIFSAVDVWGEDEDGITEENCSKNCRVVLVENIPEDISFLENGTSHLPLSAGLYNLLDQAIRVVEIVSPLWLLNSSDYESSFQPAARQGRALLSRLQGLKAKGIQLKISSGLIDSTELNTLARHNAEVHYVNMTALTKGHLHSSFWVVDRRHFYIGSASMDWRSLATVSKIHHTSHTEPHILIPHNHAHTHLNICILTQTEAVAYNYLVLLLSCCIQLYRSFHYIMSPVSPGLKCFNNVLMAQAQKYSILFGACSLRMPKRCLI